MESFRKREPLHQRIEQIKRSKFGIYHLSTFHKIDPSLELGAALGIGKEVILIYKKGSLLPETMRQLNQIEYENMSDLTEKLRKKVHS
jgi:hypothetical protein